MRLSDQWGSVENSAAAVVKVTNHNPVQPHTPKTVLSAWLAGILLNMYKFKYNNKFTASQIVI